MILNTLFYDFNFLMIYAFIKLNQLKLSICYEKF